MALFSIHMNSYLSDICRKSPQRRTYEIMIGTYYLYAHIIGKVRNQGWLFWNFTISLMIVPKSDDRNTRHIRCYIQEHVADGLQKTKTST